MTRAVLAERWWVREKTNQTVKLSYPNCEVGMYHNLGGWILSCAFLSE